RSGSASWSAGYSSEAASARWKSCASGSWRSSTTSMPRWPNRSSGPTRGALWWCDQLADYFRRAVLDAQPPVAVAEEYQRTTTAGRAALGEAAFAAAWAEGRAMSLDE